MVQRRERRTAMLPVKKGTGDGNRNTLASIWLPPFVKIERSKGILARQPYRFYNVVKL